MAKSTTFTFTTKKDFGLGNFRLALPDESVRGSGRLGKGRRSPKAKAGAFGGRVKNLFKSHNREKSTLGEGERSSPLFVPQDDSEESSGSASSSARPSPNLHRRLVGGGGFLLGAEGMKGSLENLRQQYSLEADDKMDQSNPAYKGNLIDSGVLIRLIIRPKEAKEGEEERLTLQKSPDGLGLQLSTGPPPVIVKYVDPGSQAAVAGIKRGDQIVEVNGKSCRTMIGLEWSQLMEMKSILQHVSISTLITGSKETSQAKNMKKSSTVTSIDDSDLEDLKDSSEDEQGEQNVQVEQNEQDDEDEIKQIQDAFSDAIKLLSEDNDDEEADVGKFQESNMKKQVFKEPITSAAPVKVELGDKEWRKMKQQQHLVFGDAPSDLINKKQNEKKKPNAELSLEHDSSLTSQDEVTVKDSPKQSKHNKQKHHLPFFSKIRKSPGKSEDETMEESGRLSTPENTLKKSKSFTTVSTPSTDGNTTTDIPVKLMSSGIMKGPSSRSSSRRASIIDSHIDDPSSELQTFEGIAKLDDAMSMLLVTRKEPLLGVAMGRARRDVGILRAGTRRRPPTRKHLQQQIAGSDDLLLVADQIHSVQLRPRAWTVARQSGTADEILVDPDMNKSSYLPQKQSSFSSSPKHANEVKELLREKNSFVPHVQVDPKRLSREIVTEAVSIKKQKSTGNIKEVKSVIPSTANAESTMSSSTSSSAKTSSTAHKKYSGFAALIKEGRIHNEPDQSSAGFYHRESMSKLGKSRNYSTDSTNQFSTLNSKCNPLFVKPDDEDISPPPKQTLSEKASLSSLPGLGNVRNKMAIFERH